MSTGELSAKTTPRSQSISLSTNTEEYVPPPMEKLPSAHEINPAFEPIDPDLQQEYQDPVQLHNMLIDERLHAQQQKLQMDTLREEYKCLESQLTESKRVEFADKELTQAEKEEIERLQKELHSTKLQLDDLKFQQTQGNATGFDLQNEFESTPPFFQPEMQPAEMEMIRATVIHENKHKHNLDRLASLEDEIEKYRALYNDIRSKFTILTADFDHMKIEHRDQLDAIRFESSVKVRDSERETSDFKRQHTELKKYANQQIDSMKSEIVRLHEKISSYKAEMENVEQNRLQSLKDIDSSLSEANRRAADAEKEANISKIEISRLTELLANRDEECSKLRDELRNNKNSLEEERRNVKAIEHSKSESKIKFDNQIEIVKSEFTREMNQLKVELEKYKCAWRKSNVELETTRKNAEKRSQLAESAEKCANERIEEIKREQWSIIEKIKSEKRETDVLLQKEIDEKSKTCSEFELFRQNSQAEKSDWERVKLRLESQVNSLRDEKMKINGDLSEARIRNEQLEELKRVIENEQREKNEMQRQINERDIHQRESMIERDSLKSEISKLRQELKTALEEAKRNREENRIEHLEEKNRLSQRIDQLENKLRHENEKVQKTQRDNDLLKRKYNNRLKSVNEENIILKAEKDRFTAELDLARRTQGVPKDEHDRIKRRLSQMQKRMSQFATAIYQPEHGALPLLSPSGSAEFLTASPRKSRSNQSILSPVSEINSTEWNQLSKRLDQLELDQIKNSQIFEKKSSTLQKVASSRSSGEN